MVKIEALSKKWADEIMNSLRESPKRFNELARGLSTPKKKMTSRILANRLRELELEGLILREVTDSRPPGTIYMLTDKGEQAINLTIKLNQL